jgi:hypothetical protein
MSFVGIPCSINDTEIIYVNGVGNTALQTFSTMDEIRTILTIGSLDLKKGLFSSLP